MDNIITIITSSPRRVAELQTAHKQEIERLLAIGERTSGSGANQVGNLQRHGATRWSSHYESVKSLVNMYAATCKVFECLLEHNLGISDVLCQALQKKNQDILSAMRFVQTTKTLLQALRENGWEELLQEVTLFCSKNDIDIPDFSSSYKVRNRHSRSREYPTIDHHYHFDVFNKTVDFLLVELNTRFSDRSLELLSLSAALDPRNLFESFNMDDICKLAKEFYPIDFTLQDIFCLKMELQHYQNDVISDSRFHVFTLPELCEKLVASGRSENYVLLTRLIRLVLTLAVSTAYSEQAFSAMKKVKTEILNRMDDGFLADCLTLYIEREYAISLDIDSIIDEFCAAGRRRGPF